MLRIRLARLAGKIFSLPGGWQGNGRENAEGAHPAAQHNLRFCREDGDVAGSHATGRVAISRRLHKLRSELQEAQP
jgi:hypothetical protein